MAYPSIADVQTWNANVQPVGARDDSLFGYAYAATGGNLAPGQGQQGLNDFHTWYTRVFNVVNGLAYWDSDFVLAYMQATGQWPSLPAFTTWLANNGYATLQANGSYAKSGKYPVAGAGYPPNGGQVAGTPSPTSVTPAPASGSAATALPATASGLLATLEAHPLEFAIGGGVLLLLLMRR